MTDQLNNILLSSAVATSLYAFLKGSIHIYKNYYLKSSCHDNSLTIEIITHIPTPEKEEEKNEKPNTETVVVAQEKKEEKIEEYIL